MKITLHEHSDIPSQLHLYVKLAREEGRTDADLVDDLIDTFDHYEFTMEEMAPEEAFSQSWQEGYDQAISQQGFPEPVEVIDNTNTFFGRMIAQFRTAISRNPKELSHDSPGLRRAAALYQLSTADNEVSMAKAVEAIYGAFGGAGNYGYGSEAGSALNQIYQATRENRIEYLEALKAEPSRP